MNLMSSNISPNIQAQISSKNSKKIHIYLLLMTMNFFRNFGINVRPQKICEITDRVMRWPAMTFEWPRHPIKNFKDFLKHFTPQIWKNSWLFMVDIYSSVNFFRNFGANVLLEKNTLITRKRLLSDDHTGKQELVPRLLPCRSYFICKKLSLAEFLCNLKMLERSYTDLKKRQKTPFSQKWPFQYGCSSVKTRPNWI